MSLTRSTLTPTNNNNSWLQQRPEAEAIAMPGQPERNESLQDLFSILKKYKLTIGLVTLGTVLLTLIACLLMTPKYQATATLEVIPDDVSVAGKDDGSNQTTDVKTEVQTDSKILQDKSIALEVIQTLGLQQHAPFNKVSSPQEKGLPLDQSPITRQKLLSAYMKSLKVESVPDTRLIQISFRNPNPTVAANVANSISDTFIQDYVKRRVQSSSNVSYWMTKELDLLKKKVQDSEQAVADYEQKHGMTGINLGVSGEGGDASSIQSRNPILDRLSALNQELTTSEANRISAEALSKLIQSQDPEVVLGLGGLASSTGSTMVGQGGGLDMLRTLRSQEVTLKLQYANLATKFDVNNPQLLQLQSQIDALDHAVKSEMSKISKRAENDYHYARQNEDAIKNQLALQKIEADKLRDQTVQLQVLSQEALSNRNLYQSLFSKLQEAGVTQGIHATKISIVDRAQVTAFPVSPNYPIALGVSLCAGLIFGVGAAFLRQSSDDSVVGMMDIETAIPFPVLAHLPMTAKGRSLLSVPGGDSLLISDSESGIAESFRALRTAIILSRPTPDCKLLLVTSPLGSDGKTTVAYNLAVAFAQQESRVLLIDGDMRHADLHRYFGVSNESGLSDALTTRSSTLEGRLVPHSVLPNLFLLPAGKKPHLPVELFSLPVFDRLLANARSEFDWIILDSPPILPVSDASVLSTKVDAVLPVIRSGVTSRTILLSMMKLLGRTGAPTIGLAVNAVKDESVANFYPYGYHARKAADHAKA